VLEAIAAYRKEDPDELAAQVFKNTEALFFSGMTSFMTAVATRSCAPLTYCIAAQHHVRRVEAAAPDSSGRHEVPIRNTAT